MPLPWREHIAEAQKRISSIERKVADLAIGYNIVKRRTEREVKDGLREWLKTAPRKRTAGAFARLRSGQSAQPAFAAIDRAMANIGAMTVPAPVFREVVSGFTRAEKANIFRAQSIMRKEALSFLDDMDIDRIGGSEESEILTGLIEDNKLNIIGISTRDGRRIKEQIQRAVTSGMPVAEVRRTIGNFAITSSFFALSTLAHPRATPRAYMARGVEDAVLNEQMDVENFDDQPWTILPKEEGFSQRVDKELAYKILTTIGLDRIFRDLAKNSQMMPDWRGLGLSFNSDEYYIPIREQQMEEAREWSKEKRREINR